MDLNNTIPKIEKVAILFIIAFVLNVLFAALSTPYLTSLFGIGDYGQYKLNISIATIVSLCIGYLLHIVISIWTYREAKKQNERPWTWAAFALFFGLIAVGAFYLILVIRELQALRIETRADQRNGEI